MSDGVKVPVPPKPKQPETETSSHIPVLPLYTPTDLSDSDYDRDIGYPGDFPFTRGVQATMYRGRLWTMRQYAGMGDAEESNRRTSTCWQRDDWIRRWRSICRHKLD